MLYFIHNIQLSSQRDLLLVHHVNNKKPNKMAKLQPSTLITSGQGKLESQSLYTHIRVVFQLLGSCYTFKQERKIFFFILVFFVF